MLNSYEKYKEQSIMTMTQGEMVVRLFEEIIKQLSIGIYQMEAKNIQKTNDALKKGQQIINHLRSTLDMNFEVSGYLDKLYVYFNERIINSNITKTPDGINEILPMVEELKDTFSQAEKLARMK